MRNISYKVKNISDDKNNYLKYNKKNFSNPISELDSFFNDTAQYDTIKSKVSKLTSPIALTASGYKLYKFSNTVEVNTISKKMITLGFNTNNPSVKKSIKGTLSILKSRLFKRVTILFTTYEVAKLGILLSGIEVNNFQIILIGLFTAVTVVLIYNSLIKKNIIN